MMKKDYASMSRGELETEYLQSIPEDLRACTSKLLPSMPDGYLRMRLQPRRKARKARGPKMAAHCLDEGIS